MRLQILIIGGGDDFGFDRALEVSDFLGPLVNEEDHDVDFGMIFGDRIGDLL